MITLVRSLKAFGDDSFDEILKDELQSLPAGTLPLQKGVSQGGYVDEDNLQITVFSCTDTGKFIQAKIGAFFTEIVICCGCGDDPVPQNAYCEMLLNIDKQTAETEIEVIQ